MAEFHFNRIILSKHRKLSILSWIVLSVSWEPRWAITQSGRNKKSIYLDQFQVIGSIRRISGQCRISIGQVSAILKELETGGFIKITPVSFGRKQKAGSIIELTDPLLINIVNTIRQHKLSSRNDETVNTSYEHIHEHKREHKVSTLKFEFVNTNVNDYNNTIIEGEKFPKEFSPLKGKEVPPWENV